MNLLVHLVEVEQSVHRRRGGSWRVLRCVGKTWCIASALGALMLIAPDIFPHHEDSDGRLVVHTGVNPF